MPKRARKREDEGAQKKRQLARAAAAERANDRTELAAWAGPYEGLAAPNSDPLQIQVARLNDPRLPNPQQQATAMRIGQLQGNQHLQTVVSALQRDAQTADLATDLSSLFIQRSCRPGHRGPPAGPSVRMARSGEYYHSLRPGWPDPQAARSVERPASSVSTETYRGLRLVLVHEAVDRLLRAFGSGMEIVIHVVSAIQTIGEVGQVLSRPNTRGQTLAATHGSTAPANEIHIAITESVARSPADLRVTFSHELFHGAVASPSQRQAPRGRSRRRGFPVHPRELMDILVHPEREYGGRPYEFGWFEHPASGIAPMHLNDEYRWGRYVRIPGQAAPDSAIGRLYRELLAVKTQERHERGYRVEQGREEDLAECFERYATDRESLRRERPRRYRLLEWYFYPGG
jgi:hypothetical protein